VSGVVALRSLLREEGEDDYDAAHVRIPHDLVEAHRRAGIHEWTIWRSGRDLFHLVECDDLEAAFHELSRDPANDRWQAFIGGYVERFDPTPMRLVWRMGDQAEA
jgi:L-rhamnose mutarotase